MRKVISGVIAAMLLLGLPGLALADAAGTARGVAPAAGAERDGTTLTLTVGADIFIGDLVQTGAKGNVQILFADNTELVVGPNSSLKIEDYLFRNDGSAGQLAVNMLAGSFRFATGNSAKNLYSIQTPTGTIGVRGTGFDVFVALNGLSRILLYHGALRFCTEAGDCKDLTGLCDLGEISSDETTVLGDTHVITGEERDRIKAQFIYAMNQSSLLREFWMVHARECVVNPLDVPEPPKGDKNKPNQEQETF